jgi:hypothetical protein
MAMATNECVERVVASFVSTKARWRTAGHTPRVHIALEESSETKCSCPGKVVDTREQHVA